MSADPNLSHDSTVMNLDKLLAESVREIERLRRQVQDAHHERDEYKKLYHWELARHAVEPTAEDIANAVPARPLIEQYIKQLEQP